MIKQKTPWSVSGKVKAVEIHRLSEHNILLFGEDLPILTESVIKNNFHQN